jgi:uncharacterized damage-inducible protein DinB
MVCQVACQFVDGKQEKRMATKPGAPVPPEPWLSGTLGELPVVPRALLHSLEMAREDLRKWCQPLSDAQLNERPGGVAPVVFHLRHVARSVDRMLTYAEGGQLSEEQWADAKSELDRGAKGEEIFEELDMTLRRSAERVRALAAADMETRRTVGRRQLPTTLGGLLVHIAEHTQRHVGQAVTTAKVVAGT